MENKKIHLVQIGDSSFPMGMATSEKIRLIGLGLIDAGMHVTVINRKGNYALDSGIDIPPRGTHEGIDYVFCSNTIYRPKSFLQRNFRKLLGKWNEFWLLVKFSRTTNLQYAIIHNIEFTTVMYYKLLSILLGFKTVFMYVEIATELPERNKFPTRMLDRWMENFGVNRMDGTLPISEVICRYLEETAPKVPSFKLPMICDFTKFEHLEKDPAREKFFLYCASLVYLEVIFFAIESFHKLNPPAEWNLYMVLGGQMENLPKVEAKIAELGIQDRVKIFNWIPYEELIQKYKDAEALMIPLRDTKQDRARFPHKIGEYLASGNPILTTNIGEVEHYFVDGDTSLIADEYDLDQFVEKMQFVIDNPEEARAIGMRGNQFGLDTFDCIGYGKMLHSFLLSLKGEVAPEPVAVSEKV